MLEGCTARLVTFEDLPMLLSWRNHEQVRNFMVTQHEIGIAEHYSWFSSKHADPSCVLLIVENSSGPFGFVQFGDVKAGGVSNWGFYTDPNGSRGSGRKLGKIALHYAFSILKLHKVCGQVIKNNERSIKFHQSLGFFKEGVLRDQQIINGNYHDLVCFGLISNKWDPESNFQESAIAKNSN
jgi:UDP-4-amino-4,6-dideoxy-N-acetyl-beta-L-altrosamine N-acetyltransferase